MGLLSPCVTPRVSSTRTATRPPTPSGSGVRSPLPGSTMKLRLARPTPTETDPVALTPRTGTTLRVLDPDGATFRPTAPATTSATCLTASARCASLTTTALAWAHPSSPPSVWPTTRTACASLTLTPTSPTPGATRPEGLVNCEPRCQGQYCSNGGCVDCRDFNDCGLLFSPASTYSKVCNQTAQCNYVFLSPEQSKKEDSKA